MIPGPTIYYECLICESICSTGSIISGNTIGTRLFSDGKRISPMLPEFPIINKCENCNYTYWLNRLTMYGGEISGKRIAPAIFPNIEDLHNLLQNQFHDSISEEKFLRLKLMWAFNNRVRNHKPMFNSDNEKEIWNNNQIKHLDILDESSIDDKLLKAEIFRNMGRFYDSYSVLMSIYDYKLDKLKEAFINELNKSNTLVFEIIT